MQCKMSLKLCSQPQVMRFIPLDCLYFKSSLKVDRVTFCTEWKSAFTGEGVGANNLSARTASRTHRSVSERIL